MPRLGMRLIRFGDRDGLGTLGTSEATRTRGGLSVSGSKSAHRHDLAKYGNRWDQEWVLGTEWGIRCMQSNACTTAADCLQVGR